MFFWTFYSKTYEWSNKQPWRDFWKVVYLEWHAGMRAFRGIQEYVVSVSWPQDVAGAQSWSGVVEH